MWWHSVWRARTEHFPEKWAPVFRRKCDQIKNREPSLGSIKAGRARERPFVSGGQARSRAVPTLERDEIRWNRHRALGCCLNMIFFGKPLHTFPDHALESRAS